MKRCLQLAKNGLGKTYPNPLVGSVIVYKDKIIGDGWHQKAGEAHAEVNAIQSVKDASLLKKATLFVNLEPCSHYGKTPPCSDLIIQKGIKKVVVGTLDPNPQVAGRGISRMIQAGIEVHVGCLEDECNEINKRFFTYFKKKRPYIILKWAQTKDGYIAPKQQDFGKPFWITNPDSKQLVHKWRAEEQSILVGKNTAIKDNPKLNTRLWEGENPVRVLIDSKLETMQQPEKLHLLDGSIKTLIFCSKTSENQKNLIFEQIDFNHRVPEQIMDVLYLHKLQSLIIEGGKRTLQEFIDSGLWDEARVFTGTSYLKSGIEAPALNAVPVKSTSIGQDTLNLYKNEH